MARAIVFVCALIWLGCVGAAILALGAPAEGDGFLRGSNRIEGFLVWQFAALGAAIVGVIALRLTSASRSMLLKALGLGPIILSALLVLALVAVIAWAAFAPQPAVAPSDTLPVTTTPS